MRIPSNPIAASMVTSSPTSSMTVPAAPLNERDLWTNPAAAAALRSTADLLEQIEAGIARNMQNVDMVRGYANDLNSTIEIFATATAAITSDASKENDAFLPLISTAGGGVEHAEARLASKELSSTWPLERGDILASIRRARSISSNVADQLDPRFTRSPRG